MDAKLPQLTDQYLLECARIFLRYSNFRSAREIYSTLLQKNVRHTEALKGLGTCFYREGKWEEARKCFTAYALLTGNVDGKIWAGSCYAKQGNLTAASQYFEQSGGAESIFRESSMSPVIIPEDVLLSLKGI